MDRNGTIDLFITSSGKCNKCNLSIACNSQMSLCTPHDPEPCRDPEAPDDAFDLNFTISKRTTTTLRRHSHRRPSSPAPSSSPPSAASSPTPPAIGDYTIDGYPDLLILTSHSDSGSRTTTLLESRPCDKASCRRAWSTTDDASGRTGGRDAHLDDGCRERALDLQKVMMCSDQLPPPQSSFLPCPPNPRTPTLASAARNKYVTGLGTSSTSEAASSPTRSSSSIPTSRRANKGETRGSWST